MFCKAVMFYLCLTRTRLHLAIYFCLHKGKCPVKAAESQARSRLFEIALVLVRLDHVATVTVNANHGVMCV